jgi:hypothetical protein
MVVSQMQQKARNRNDLRGSTENIELQIEQHEWMLRNGYFTLDYGSV